MLPDYTAEARGGAPYDYERPHYINRHSGSAYSRVMQDPQAHQFLHENVFDHLGMVVGPKVLYLCS